MLSLIHPFPRSAWISVGSGAIRKCDSTLTANFQQKQAQQTLTEVSPHDPPVLPSIILESNTNMAVCDVVQAESRCLGHRGQYSPRSIVSSDKMYAHPSSSRDSGSMLTAADLALQVLDDVIMTRWKVLPRDQCQGKPPR